MRFAARGSVRGRRAVGIAVAALLGGATACGTEAEAVTPAEAVSRAAERTVDVESLRYRVTGTLPEHGKVRAEASMTVRPSAMSMELTGLGESEDKPLGVRFADGVLYAQGDTAAIGAPKDRDWLSAEPAVWGRGAAYNNTYGVVPGELEASPLSQSTLLTGSQDVREAGTETIDGTGTTHYRGTVTTKGLRAAQAAAEDKATRELRTNSLDQFMMLRVEGTLTMELWIDGDGRVKRYRVQGETHAREEGRMVDGGPLDMTVTFLDVDRPVTVEIPAAGDTVDIAELADEAPEG